MQDVPEIIKHCKAPGPLYQTVLTEGELRQLNNMMGRLYQLAEAATAVSCLSVTVSCRTRLLQLIRGRCMSSSRQDTA